MPTTNVNLFSQILGLIDRNSFTKIVNNHDSDRHCKGVNTWTHLVSMLFCQFAKANSVREISNGLKSATGNLNHLGVSCSPSKSTISYQNQQRNWQVFKDLYFELFNSLNSGLQKKRQFARMLKRKIFIVDSTVISLCLSLFDWAQYRKRKGAIKLHTVLDYDTCLPVYMHMTDGLKHDVAIAKTLNIPSGSVLVMDRAYVDFNWLNVLDSRRITFVSRLKKNIQYSVVKENEIKDKTGLIVKDQIIVLTGVKTAINYPKELRIVVVYDPVKKAELTFLTNNTSWTAETISQLYKARWEIETFFKQIKQVLKIKTFIGTSPNAILIQVWSALITILLLKYLQNKAKYAWHLSNLVGLIRVNLFAKIDLWYWLNHPFIKMKPPASQQLSIFIT
ncbi:MAG: IS4 family transposase, partial [Bacteroidia bacterium]|nr:IS4 family transposase [Bacteroidia bacterium]MBX2985884.1 IS4 family transposase [Bacteroidia bacterium]MCO5253750.1 IS4 family transposase [Bacteroidota bacterium]MCO5254471.1 IS4 family transposase [Bacteroidota bacterium]MCO5254476.1 IS4 family transposase [Bacteroidota bacterium]